MSTHAWQHAGKSPVTVGTRVERLQVQDDTHAIGEERGRRPASLSQDTPGCTRLGLQTVLLLSSVAFLPIPQAAGLAPFGQRGRRAGSGDPVPTTTVRPSLPSR